MYTNKSLLGGEKTIHTLLMLFLLILIYKIDKFITYKTKYKNILYLVTCKIKKKPNVYNEHQKRDPPILLEKLM